MKILISATACNPLGVSEGLHGWMICRSLADIGELWLLVSAEHKAGIEEARSKGMVPEGMHFVFIGEPKGYNQNRLLARIQSWWRYVEFSRKIIPVAAKLHEEIQFDVVHHVTYSTWRVGCPLWRLGIPLIWGPISGTEVFPLLRFGKLLSIPSFVFELLRGLSGTLSRLSPEVNQ